MNRRSLTPLLSLTITAGLLLAASPAAARNPIAIGITKSNGKETIAQFDAFTVKNGGIAAKLWTLRSKWGGDDRDFPTDDVNALAARGATAVIWWSPINPAKWWKGKYEDLRTILDGDHDAYITQWATDAKAAGHEMVVRFAHEGNTHVFPWGKTWFKNNPKKYRKAWRHVVKIFDGLGADNVKFLWSVAKKSCSGCNPYESWYPGDSYVDFVGFSGFNWGGHNGRKWQSMVKAYTQPMKKLKQFTDKPVLVAESASHFKNGNKSKWIKKGYNAVYDKWNRLKGILYLDSDEPHENVGHPDWRLKKPNNGSAMSQYTKIAAKPEFQGELP